MFASFPLFSDKPNTLYISFMHMEESKAKLPKILLFTSNDARIDEDYAIHHKFVEEDHNLL